MLNRNAETMNRSELEGLIAQTMQKPTNPPLSSKQNFQSQVRGLSVRPAHRQTRSESEVESDRHELHQISSLRVQHKRNASAVPSSQRAVLSETSHNLQRSQTATFTNNGVPDFSAEEREAWSKKSPKPTSTSTRSRHDKRASSPPHRQAVQQRQHLLFPPPECLEPVPQPRKHARQPSLRQFEPLQPEADLDRPKTSRGLPAQSPERTEPSNGTRYQGAETKKQENSDARLTSTRPSKFLEGSMNDRSVGVASSWYHDNTSGSESLDESASSSAGDIDTDSDATTRATKPLPPTPAPTTTKKSIFRFGGGRNSEDSAHRVEEGPKVAKEHKGLRKSISVWNLHALGEKIFGGSTNDAASETSVDTITTKRGKAQKDRKTSSTPNLDILNERKRKAEEAYAQQFGFKKQKSNIGESVASTPSHVPNHKTTLDDKRPKTPIILRRKREQRTPADYKRPAETLDSQKRPSRKDLEKENRELRSILKGSQSMTFSRSASLSSIDLVAKGQEDFIRGPVVILSPGRKQGRGGEDIPPVPKLPEQKVLAELQNRSGRMRPEAATKKENPAIFETIEECEEGGEMERSEREISVPGHWEWPEDVF